MKPATRRVKVRIGDKEYLVEVGDLSARPVRATVGGRTYLVEVEEGLDGAPPKPGRVAPAAPEEQVQPAPSAAPFSPASVSAPLPGDVVEVLVEPGEAVSAGDALVVLEAMKMRNLIRSPRAGRVAAVHVSPGQSVDFGDGLVTLE